MCTQTVSSARSLSAKPRALQLAVWAGWALLAASGLCAVALRFYAFDRLPGINGDEPQYAVHAHAFLSGAPLWSLRTGSDLPMNPVFFGTVLLLQALLPATLWSLRLAAVVLSLITVSLSWALFRRRGPMFAITFACLVAVLPIHLGYARFAWDPAAIPSASVLALGAATRLRPGWTLSAFALALWVHPTSVFLAPLLLSPFVARHWPRRWSGSATRTAAALVVVGLPAAAALLWWSMRRDLLPEAVLRVLRGDLATVALERARRPAQLRDFILGYADLLSGPTIYRYIAGSLPARAATLHRWLSGLLLMPLLAAGVHNLRRRRRGIDLALALGLALSLLAEYLLAGPSALAPKTERYAVCLTVPGCYVLAACVDALATSALRGGLLRLAVGALGFTLIGAFSSYYLAALHRPDPQREDTFRSGPVEPKRAALSAIMRERDPAHTSLVYVEDWWIYWTLRYLAPPATGVRVTIYKQGWDYRFPKDFEPPRYDPARMDLFGVAWAGRDLDARFAKLAREQVAIFGYEPGPILRVHKLEALPGRRKPRKRSK